MRIEWMRVSRLVLSLIAAAAVAGALAPRGASLAGEEAVGPLAKLPSAPGPHLEKVKALGDGQWVNLGKPAPDPKWGLGYGRAYSPKMAYAEDLEGAFINGQGVHGYVKKESNRVMDDTWFYDANAHAWVCCYPGTHVPTVNEDWKVDERGFLVGKDGQSPPMVGIVHGYNSISYSPKLKRFITWHGVGYTAKEIQEFWKKAFPDKAASSNYHNRQYPYFYDVATGRWSRDKTDNGPGSFQIYGANCEWLPTKDRFALYLWDKDVWLYDPAELHWEKAGAQGPAPAGGYEGLSCFDTKRNRIMCFNSKSGALGIYDVAGNVWVKPGDDFSPQTVTDGGMCTNGGMADYDSANDVAIVFLGGKNKDKHGAFVYDCEKGKWLNREPLPDSARKGRSGFYSRKHNAHYFWDVGDSRTTPGDIWVWRYRNPK